MELLINKTDIEKYFQVALGRNEADIKKFIQQAQMFDLKKLLPEKFFYDLIKNRSQANYQALINGCEYTYEDFEYQHEGLKGVLAHFAYGTYLFKGGITDTSFGQVIKKSQHSDPVDFKERKDWYYKHREQANILFEDVKNYLDRNVDQFPVWAECTTVVTKRRFKTKLIQ